MKRQYRHNFGCRALALAGCLLGLLSGWLAAPASESLPSDLQSIDFVYVHGVNTHKENSREVIRKRFSLFHEYFIDSLKKDRTSSHILTEGGRKVVNQAPSLFYWSHLNQQSIVEVNDNVALGKALQSRIASLVQDNLATMMHDVFWLVRRSNQLKIGDSLNRHVQKEIPTKDQIVLVGYSGGAVITFDYLLYYLPYINIYKVLQTSNLPPELIEAFQPEHRQRTCLRAVLDSNFGRMDNDGDVILFLDQLQVKDMALLEKLNHAYVRERIPELLAKTQEVCLPQNKVRGLITFGSPITALSANENDPDIDAKLTPAMVKYLFDRNIFWLNLNRVNDPLGLPIDDLHMIELVKKEYQWELPKTPGGFVFNNVTRKKGAYFYKAHSWYLSRPRDFSEFVVESLKAGYNRYYPE